MRSATTRRPTRRRRLDVGRLLARVLCALFAVVGTLPLAASALARTESVRVWAADQTARLVHDLVGLAARYEVQVGFWPLELVLTDVVIPASDGGEPALTAARISVTPRIFSLLAGRIDVGDIEIERPRARAVLRDGELVNVKYRLPETSPSASRLERAPFASLAVTDATALVDVDGTVVRAGPMDIDVFAEPGPAFEVAVRSGESTIVRERTVADAADATKEATWVDDDVLCRLDLRARVEEGAALIRRLSLIGGIDDDPAPKTLPSCAAEGSEDAPERVLLRLSQVQFVLDGAEPKIVDGHVVARVPVSAVNRLGVGPFGGWVGVAGDVHYERGMRLPDFRGRARGGSITMGPYRFTPAFDAEVRIDRERIEVPSMTARYGKHGEARIRDVSVAPFDEGLPLSVGEVIGEKIRFQDFMEDVDVTKDTIVQWDLDKTIVRDFEGTLDPLKLEGDLAAETRNFEVFDRAYHDKNRKHMIGVKAANVRGRFGVRPEAISFQGMTASFGKSRVFTSVAVGFDNTLRLNVNEGSVINLADASPLVDIPMSGVVKIQASMAGIADEAELKGELSIESLVFGGFPLGDVESSKLSFKPLVINVSDLRGKKGSSHFRVPSARLDFGSNANLLADARIESDRFDIRDFFHMFHFDDDPRFDPLKGAGKVSARLHYDMGGEKDRCGSGYLRVDGSVDMSDLDLFEEKYDRGTAEFDFRWFDSDASHLGMQFTAPSVILTKGSGTLLGDIRLTEGGVLRAHMVGTQVPLAKIQAFGDLGQRVDGRVSAIAEVGGTIDAMEASVKATVSPVRVGRATLPASELTVNLVPEKRPLETTGKTSCGRPVPAPFDPEVYAADRSTGVFHVNGRLFGKQVHLEDVQITRQTAKRVRGKVVLDGLDLGAAGELSPLLALSERRAEGRLDATIDLQSLEMANPGNARALFSIRRFWFGRSGLRVDLEKPATVALESRSLDIPSAPLAITTPGGEKTYFEVKGSITDLGRESNMNLSLALQPTDLRRFARMVPRAERLVGTLEGNLRLTGPMAAPRHSGRLELRNGEVDFRGSPLSFSNVGVVVAIQPDEIQLVEAHATVGSGSLSARGSAPINAFNLGPARGVITARGIDLSSASGIEMVVDADLEAQYKPNAQRSTGEDTLPKVTGLVTLRSFEYTRKVTMNADIASLGKRGKRTEFESFDPENDFVEFDVMVRSENPLVIENDLVEANLVVEDPGLNLSGTNQRFGIRGQLGVVKGGRIRLRRNEFEITQGQVRFNDTERIAPRVDVTAVTEYTRYADSQSTADATAAAGSVAGSAAGGRWRITMHAYGDADNLRVDLKSEPELAQDDIFLLLTLGLTRAELDQAQSASAGQSVALEALGRLTGADEAVTENIPVIDEFRFGSAYSSRTGRTEPTVTIGKRLTQRIRAYVTSGLTDSREIRSNLQVRLSPRVSVEGSYDNVNDISSSALGNLGADVRWRLEFE